MKLRTFSTTSRESFSWNTAWENPVSTSNRLTGDEARSTNCRCASRDMPSAVSIWFMLAATLATSAVSRRAIGTAACRSCVVATCAAATATRCTGCSPATVSP